MVPRRGGPGAPTLWNVDAQPPGWSQSTCEQWQHLGPSRCQCVPLITERTLTLGARKPDRVSRAHLAPGCWGVAPLSIRSPPLHRAVSRGPQQLRSPPVNCELATRHVQTHALPESRALPSPGKGGGIPSEGQ